MKTHNNPLIDGAVLRSFLSQNYVLNMYQNGKDGFYCHQTRKYILFDPTVQQWDKASILELFNGKTAFPSEVEYARLVVFNQENQ
jgi:hypothetical protein